MGYKIKVRGTTYDLKDGFTIKEEFNETLDSATVQFTTYGEELNKEPFDDVTIFHTDSNVMSDKYFEVDSIVDDIYSFGDSLDNSDHQYTMSLFSETKELERITCPSLSITQPINPNATKTKVWTVINRFCAHFLPKIKVQDGEGGWDYVGIFSIDPAVQTKFENVVCPEFQWDNPTLREVLNDLMSTLDCIVVVKDHVITYYELTALGNAIDTSKLTRMTSNFSSSDYISELTMYMKNGVGKTLTKSYRYQTPRTTDESGEITTNNMSITTQKPIYSIKSLKLYYITADPDLSGTKMRLHCADVYDRVLEYDEWRIKSRRSLLNFYAVLPHWTDSNGFEAPEHRICYLYYKRGGNSIENLGTIYKGGALLSETFLTYTYVGICNALRSLNASQKVDFEDSLENEPRRLFYEIEYETLYEQAMHFGKNLPNNHPENRVFDNQSNAYIDIQHQSIFEYAKVNRLSNQIKEIYGEYEAESEVPSLGDYIDDYILFSKETSYYDNKIMFHGFLTKNYILKDYYTGVMAKKRSWAIAPQNEALTRHEIFKVYVEASFSKKNDTISILNNIGYTSHGQGLIYDLTYVKLETSDVVASYELNRVRLYTYSSSGRNYHPAYQKAFAMDSDVEILGNSICWTFGFEDNYKASDYVIKDDNMWTQNFYTYTNDDGTFTRLTFDIVYNIPDYLVNDLPVPYEQGGDGEVENDDRVDDEELFRSKPMVNRLVLSSQNSDPVYGFTVQSSLYKDSREIIKATMQFEYCSDTPDIIVKPKFLEWVRAVNAGTDKNSKLHVWVRYTGKYTEHDTTGQGYRAVGGNYISYTQFASNAKSIFITQNAYSFTNVTAWCITDDNEEILLAVNKNQGIYFNLLRSRDDNIYYSNLDKTIVGNIKEGGTANLAQNVSNHETELQNQISNNVAGSFHQSVNLVVPSVGGSGSGRVIDKNNTFQIVELENEP